MAFPAWLSEGCTYTPRVLLLAPRSISLLPCLGFFQLIEYDLVRSLGLPVGLRVFDRGRNRLDAQVVIEGLQASINKLSTIISDYCVGDAELANNASPYEILDIFGRDGCKGYGLDPFGKVVDSHEEEFGLPFSWHKGTDDVHPPDGKRPWGDDTVQLFRPYVMDGRPPHPLGDRYLGGDRYPLGMRC